MRKISELAVIKAKQWFGTNGQKPSESQLNASNKSSSVLLVVKELRVLWFWVPFFNRIISVLPESSTSVWTNDSQSRDQDHQSYHTSEHVAKVKSPGRGLVQLSVVLSWWPLNSSWTPDSVKHLKVQV